MIMLNTSKITNGSLHGRRKGGGKRHVTPPKALKGGVRGGNFGGVKV